LAFHSLSPLCCTTPCICRHWDLDRSSVSGSRRFEHWDFSQTMSTPRRYFPTWRPTLCACVNGWTRSPVAAPRGERLGGRYGTCAELVGRKFVGPTRPQPRAAAAWRTRVPSTFVFVRIRPGSVFGVLVHRVFCTTPGTKLTPLCLYKRALYSRVLCRAFSASQKSKNLSVFSLFCHSLFTANRPGRGLCRELRGDQRPSKRPRA